MSVNLYWVLVYLMAVSLVAVLLTTSDKRRAIRQRRRIAEATLLWVAAAGGAAAMLATMRHIRHKTRHKKFMWGLPLLILAQVILLACLIGCGVLVL